MDKFWYILASITAIGILLVSLGYHWFGIGFLAFSAILALIIVISHIWFSNRAWEFRTNGNGGLQHRYFVSGTLIKWKSRSPQVELMTYELYFCKKVTIKCIHFRHGGDNFETPRKWRMDFLDKTSTPIPIYGHKLPYIETGDPETKPNSSEILVKLKQPLQAYAVRVIVREPEIINGEIQYWTIQDIRVQVKILLGLKYTIGESWLDRL